MYLKIKVDSMSEIGIYILTYPGDYYLSTALIRSLRYFNQDIPIMVIPGEGVNRNDHPFDVPLMPTPDGFWGQMRHADRKFWSFQGPYEKFIYLDADIICTRSIAPFIRKLKQQNGKFLNLEICVEDEQWIPAITDTEHEFHEQYINRVNSQLGNLDLLKEFDPGFDPYAHYPFNDGLFASSRLTIEEDAFEDLYSRERDFFKRRLNKEFSWKSFDLFFGDQGRLNYLVDRLGLKRSTLFPYGHYLWGGVPVAVPLEQVLAGEAEYNFIHWAGCPRPNPSLFCKEPLLPLLTLAYTALPSEYKSLKEIPAYSVWWYFAAEEQQRWKKLGERLSWTWCDARLILNRAIKRAFRLLRRKFAFIAR